MIINVGEGVIICRLEPKMYTLYFFKQQPGKKYFKRADLAIKQEEEYWKKHKRWKANNEQVDCRLDIGI